MTSDDKWLAERDHWKISSASKVFWISFAMPGFIIDWTLNDSIQKQKRNHIRAFTVMNLSPTELKFKNRGA